MSLGNTQLGKLSVSRLVIGGNPFSGFSHQGIERDGEMRHYFTTAHIKDTLLQAQSLGVNTVISRADHHVMRVLMEFWDDGGTLQWIAQTCTELGPIRNGVHNAIAGHASACYLHGGSMDYALAQNNFDEVHEAIAIARDAGLAVGVAGHNPKVFTWAEENLDVDFYMCSYYNPTPRDAAPGHVAGAAEWFHPDDRDRMVQTIANLQKPVIHYKVFAAGRNEPAEALGFVAKHLRQQDAVCVGIFPKDKPDMLAEDLRLLEGFTNR